MRTGLVTLDGKGRVALFNTAAEDILGYDAREIRGRPCGEVFEGLIDTLRASPSGVSGGAASGSPAGPDRRGRANESPGPGTETLLETTARHKDGRSVPVVVTPYVTPGNGDAASRSVTVLLFRDARELAKMEGQLQHIDRLRSLDEFAAGIVHEIRNPLASISINSQHMVEEIGKCCQRLCTRTARSARFREEMLDIIADVRSIESIVKGVLDFARPGESHVRETRIEDVVEEVLRLSKMSLRRQGIRLVADLPRPGPSAASARPTTLPGRDDRDSRDRRPPSRSSACALSSRADPVEEGGRARVRVDVSQMKQVFLNVVRNACEAMPEGGELRVSVGHNGDGGRHVRVAVEDTGRGIPEEYRERIFHPFFSMQGDGLGLGLAISRKIVENHGGRIEVKSSPGKGTEFGVVLPAV